MVELNKRIDEIAASMARAPNTSHRGKSGRYQLYNQTRQAVQTTSPRAATEQLAVTEEPRWATTARAPATGLSLPAQIPEASVHVPFASAETRCDSSYLWDGHTPSFARKGDKGAKLRTAISGDTLVPGLELAEGVQLKLAPLQTPVLRLRKRRSWSPNLLARSTQGSELAPLAPVTVSRI